MFRRLKLFFQAVQTVRAVRKGGDPDAAIDQLMQKAGLGGDDGDAEASWDNAAADTLLDPPFDRLYPDQHSLTAHHLTMIRQMRLSWNGTESGAPQCHPHNSFTGGRAPDLVREFLGDADDAGVADFMISLLPALSVFTDQATLTPGHYTLTNMDAASLGESKQGLRDADTLFAISDDMQIEIDADDIALARAATWEWPYEDDMLDALERGDIAGPTVDPKRPYGDMSYYALDVHRVLDWPVEARNEDGFIQLTEAQEAEATRLHFRQLGVMQALLEHGAVTL
ncbi:MAG: hypothetical protein AAGL23_12550 [Pseudomonadota bacterium]